MAFLKALKAKIHQYRNKDFRKNIEETKKKTYLFRDHEEVFSTERGGIIRKKKNIVSPFSRIITRINEVRTESSSTLNIIGLILLWLSGYIIFFSSYFQIAPSRVLIEGMDSSIDTNICYQAIDDLYGKNIFTINNSTVLRSIKKYQKQVSRIDLDYLYPNNIKILVYSLPIEFQSTVYGIDKKWWLTTNGVLIPESKLSETEKLWDTIELISPRLKETIFLDYKEVFAEELVSVIRKTLEIIRSDFSDFRLAKTRYFENEQELHITLESGVRIFLSLDSTLKNQLLSLKTYALAHRDVFLKWDTTYVDARIVWKIFVCTDKVVCKKNMQNLYWNIYE